MIFLLYDIYIIKKYLYNLSEQYIDIINENKVSKFETNLKNSDNIIKEPPKHFSTKNIKSNTFENLKFEERSTNRLYSLYSSRKQKKLSKGKILLDSPTIINAEKKPGKQKIYPFKIRNINKTKSISIKNSFNEYLKTDLDDLEYDDAIKRDKREFCNYFTDKIKDNQILVNTFFNKENIKPLSIKIILFLLNIDLYFVINGLFISEEYIIELYHLEGEDSFFSYISRSIGRFFYATMISGIVGFIIDCIFIEEKKIKKIFLREKDDKLKLRYEISNIILNIEKRYKIFLLICLFISIISWYYVSCFNYVYKNVKIEWIKSSVTIIFIMQILSIILCFLDAILREISFKCKSEKIYKLRKIIS